MFRLYQITPKLKQLKQCRNDVATLCCATNRRCESSRVTSPLVRQLTHKKMRYNPPF